MLFFYSYLEIESYADDWHTIFLNLISNSLRHGFKGRAGGLIRIHIAVQSNRLKLDYSDDGNGIAPEVLARIFDPFFTTDLQQGMGLGMHLVYNLITHRLGGSIDCDSQSGLGVSFHITIPLS
jgi:signal transduction histidine kinase